MTEHEEKIEKLKTYFEKCDDVVMAFLFGSQAKGYARIISDWDIGVYIRNCLKSPYLLQLHSFARYCVSPPRRILPIYALVVLPCPARNHAISPRRRLFRQFLR